MLRALSSLCWCPAQRLNTSNSSPRLAPFRNKLTAAHLALISGRSKSDESARWQRHEVAWPFHPGTCICNTYGAPKGPRQIQTRLNCLLGISLLHKAMQTTRRSAYIAQSIRASGRCTGRVVSTIVRGSFRHTPRACIPAPVT
jgi:hypothetical protein